MREGYKKTEVGIIPEDWEVVNINEVASRYSGHTPNKKIENYWNGEIPWISLKDTKKLDNREIYNTEDYTTQDGIDNSSAVLLPRGTIVLSRDATVGKVGIMGTEMATSQHFINYVCCSKLNNIYLYYDFINKKEIFDRIAIGSTIKTIGLDFFKKLNIALPPLKEQEKIAEILLTVDSQIDDTKKFIEKSKELKKGLMQKLLTKGIGHSEFKKTKVGEIPVEWEVKKLGELGNYYNGLTGKTKSDFENGNCKFITYSNVNLNTFVDLESLGSVNIFDNEKQNCVKYGDIIFTGSSENPEEAGMTSVFIKNIDNIYLNSFCFGYRLNNILDINPKFLAYYLRGEEFRKNIFPLAQGSTRYNISKTEVMNLEVVIPSTNEQEKIVDILLSIDNQIKEYKNKKQKLEELKKGLMQQLLTGKIRAYKNT